MIEYKHRLSAKEIKALEDAIHRIVKIALDSNTPTYAKFKACKHVLDFSMGKPIRVDEHIKPIGIKLSEANLEEILKDIELLNTSTTPFNQNYLPKNDNVIDLLNISTNKSISLNKHLYSRNKNATRKSNG